MNESTEEGLAQIVAVGSVPAGRSVGDLGKVCVGGWTSRRRNTPKTLRLVDQVDEALSAAHRLAASGTQGAAEEAQPQAQREKPAAQHGNKVALSYYCTIQAADRSVLYSVIRSRPVYHKCPDTGFMKTLDTFTELSDRSLRCGCPNRDCYVYQYTDKQPTDKEHRAS